MGSRRGIEPATEDQQRLRWLWCTAAVLWLVAGINVLRIGIISALEESEWLWAGLWIVVSLAFFGLLIFPRVVRRNVGYARSLDRPRLWNCFSPASWVVMVVMISLGISVRHWGLAPHSFISGFYIGLGSALSLSALTYVRLFIQTYR